MKKPKPTTVCHGCGTTFEGSRRFCTRVCEKTHECKATGTTKFLRNKVAPLFQKMIRAEYGAIPSGYTNVVRDNEIVPVYRYIGQCACITCGKVLAWDSGIKGIHTGHFVSSRRTSILLVEENVAPQCSSCNYFRNGAPTEFRMWMEHVRGMDVINDLARLKTESVSYSREELVEFWFKFTERLKAAQERMKKGHGS